MYHAACKVEFQPFKRLYSQLTFFNFLLKKKKIVVRSNGFRPETDNKAKLRQDFRDVDIGATS